MQLAPAEPGLAAGAEGKRFELLVRGYRTLVFKTSSIGRSDNLPGSSVSWLNLLGQNPRA